MVGPPELVIEVGHSSRSHDLGAKKAAYEKAGVLEYLFVRLDPEQVRWFAVDRWDVRRDRASARRSASFGRGPSPGSGWIRKHLFAEDPDGLIAALDRGLATPEHAAFAAMLAARLGAAPGRARAMNTAEHPSGPRPAPVMACGWTGRPSTRLYRGHAGGDPGRTRRRSRPYMPSPVRSEHGDVGPLRHVLARCILPAVHPRPRQLGQRLDATGGRHRDPARFPAPDSRGARRPDPDRRRLRHRPARAGHRDRQVQPCLRPRGRRRRTTSGPASRNTSSSASSPTRSAGSPSVDGRHARDRDGGGRWRVSLGPLPGALAGPVGPVRRGPGWA